MNTWHPPLSSLSGARSVRDAVRSRALGCVRVCVDTRERTHMSIFIEREAEGEEADGHDDDDDDKEDEGQIEGLFAEKGDEAQKDRDGLHLAAGARRRLEEEEGEMAAMQAAAERYERMGHAYVNSGDGPGGGGNRPSNGEMSELARATRAAREEEKEEEYRLAAAARAAAAAEAAAAAKVAAAKQRALWDLLELESGGGGSPVKPPTAETAAAAATPAAAAADGAESAGAHGGEAASGSGGAKPKEKYRIKKKAKTS